MLHKNLALPSIPFLMMLHAWSALVLAALLVTPGLLLASDVAFDLPVPDRQHGDPGRSFGCIVVWDHEISMMHRSFKGSRTDARGSKPNSRRRQLSCNRGRSFPCQLMLNSPQSREMQSREMPFIDGRDVSPVAAISR